MHKLEHQHQICKYRNLPGHNKIMRFFTSYETESCPVMMIFPFEKYSQNPEEKLNAERLLLEPGYSC